MDEEKRPGATSSKRSPLYWFDGLVKKFIPNFNVRAILYFSVIFAFAMFIQLWRISSTPSVPQKAATQEKQEIVLADQAYWDSPEYQNKIKNQTVISFTQELAHWLNGQDQELVKRRFEDLLFVNSGLTSDTGGDLAQIVPENFNYLENIGRARYQYAKDKGFLSDSPSLVKLGTLVCNVDAKTEQVTGIEIYDWRYASMPKLVSLMSVKPDWKVRIGDRILDISDPRLIDKDLLKSRSSETQPVGLFSFLVFRDPTTNRIVLADSTILENNGVDAKLTLSRIDTHWDKEPKSYFTAVYEGCKQIHKYPQIPYGHSD